MWALFSPPHKPKVTSLKASCNPRKHHYHHHHNHCYHHIHHCHYYLFIPLKYFCIIIIIVEIPMILSCPGPEPYQKALASRTRCQVLPGSLSSQDRGQEGRGQSVLFVWRTSLPVISTTPPTHAPVVAYVIYGIYYHQAYHVSLNQLNFAHLPVYTVWVVKSFSRPRVILNIFWMWPKRSRKYLNILPITVISLIQP